MIDFFKDYYIYIILFIVMINVRFIRFCKSNKPIFKDFYSLQIIQYSLFVLLIVNIALDFSNISVFIKDITSFSEMVTTSGVLSGFIFAGISILYSFMANDKISSQFKYDFMDHVFIKLFLSIFLSISVIVVYVLLLIFPNFIIYEMVRMLIILFLLSLFYFVFSLFELYRFLRRLKKVL